METRHNVEDDIKWVNFINWSLCLVNQFVEKLWKWNILLLSDYLVIPKLWLDAISSSILIVIGLLDIV